MNGWRRFEQVSQTWNSSRYWAIRVVGRTLEVRLGWIGGDETEQRFEHASEADAARVATQRIQAKQRAGWVEADQVADTRALVLARGESIEQAIAQDPANLDNWAVYADALQAADPVTGELVALALALARAEPTSERAQLQARIDELERTHARELFGATLAGVLADPKYRYVVTLERQVGMIVGATLVNPESPTVKLHALLGALFDLPLARLLWRLSIRLPNALPECAQALEAFVARRHPHLRRLSLSLLADVPSSKSKMLEISQLLEQTPRLEHLELEGSFVGDASHPSLRELTLRVYVAPQWMLPQWRLPRLQHLVIESRHHADELVENLVRAPWLAQLESLELRKSGMTNIGVQIFIAHAGSFAPIRKLRVLGHEADLDHIAALRAALPNIEVRANPYGVD
jgi:predicted DNA-binding WGR domain protein